MKKRTSEGKQLRASMKAYRQAQVQLAIFRDGGLCVFHWYMKGEEHPMDDVHHVFGRGRRVGDPRERYFSLLCTCRECHPPPIRTRVPKPALEYVLDVLRKMNQEPLNLDFEHPDKEYKKFLRGR